jgi:dihydroxyacetone kinase-like protein
MSEEPSPENGPGPVIDAAFFRRWLTAAAEVIDREATRLTELDSPIGDADHGSNLRRGFTAARTAIEKEPPLTPGDVLVQTGRQLISTVGGAVQGDKTMIDALVPAVEALSFALDKGAGLIEALAAARIAAEEGALATVPLQARKGRASYLGERSIGHQDPGATSSALLLGALARTAAQEGTG